MKSTCYKVIIILSFILMVAIAAPSSASANAPHIYGYLKTKDTGTPVPGVWIKWTERSDVSRVGNPNWVTERYAQTDINGKFFFESVADFTSMSPSDPNFNKEYNTFIDSNLDGTTDVRMYGKPYNDTNYHFGCGQNPHDFSVVKPKGSPLNYDASEINPFSMNNILVSQNIGVIYATTGPVATPKVYTPCSGTDCTKKEIGTLDQFGGFVASTGTVPPNTTQWIRINIKPRTNLIGGERQLLITEKVNTSYFKLIDPGNDYSALKLYIKTQTEYQDLTYICGPQLYNCIDYSDDQSAIFRLPETPLGQELSLFFKVIPYKNSGSTAVLIDDSSSKIKYLSDGYETSITNSSIIINNIVTPFWVTSNGGNIFSSASIQSLLPTGQFLNNDPSGLVQSASTIDVGSGQISKSGWTLRNYRSDLSEITYDQFLKKHTGQVTEINTSQLSTLTTGYYHISGDLTVTASDISSVSGKKIIIFVSGNVYLETPITIAKDGNSLLAIISSQNIGIRPTVKGNNSLQGIYIADGKINTACAATFTSTGDCSASAAERQSNLIIEGTIGSTGVKGSQSEIKLNRTNTTNVASEEFRFRPDLSFAMSDMLGNKLYSWKETEK